jgi:hypothetical protein
MAKISSGKLTLEIIVRSYDQEGEKERGLEVVLYGINFLWDGKSIINKTLMKGYASSSTCIASECDFVYNDFVPKLRKLIDGEIDELGWCGIDDGINLKIYSGKEKESDRLYFVESELDTCNFKGSESPPTAEGISLKMSVYREQLEELYTDLKAEQANG